MMNNYSLAEAYVMGKMNREKLKKEEEGENTKKKMISTSTDSSPNYDAKKQGSSWLLRKMKIHPSNKANSNNSVK
uniref:Uncharacterized protein n=2 Tax=Cucumis melo TaxID=3656 RepID=A0A9I9CTA2_CUCME|nr:hypothetical protein [Cucumis melo subsp. melo]